MVCLKAIQEAKKKKRPCFTGSWLQFHKNKILCTNSCWKYLPVQAISPPPFGKLTCRLKTTENQMLLAVSQICEVNIRLGPMFALLILGGSKLSFDNEITYFEFAGSCKDSIWKCWEVRIFTVIPKMDPQKNPDKINCRNGLAPSVSLAERQNQRVTRILLIRIQNSLLKIQSSSRISLLLQKK